MIKIIKEKMRDFYFKKLAKRETSWDYLLKKISNSKVCPLDTIKQWEKDIELDKKKSSLLLQISFLKKFPELSHYLLDNKSFTYPFIDIPSGYSKIKFIDSLMTNDLLRQDHAAWLALFSCHKSTHLLGLEKNYDYTKYQDISRKFLLHPDFKEIYKDKKRRDTIISSCPTNASLMLFSIFLEMDLDNSKHQGKINKI